MSILQTSDLRKYYGTEPNITRALDGVNFSVEEGEFVAVVGTSGSGKSTLLHMMGGLDNPTSGSVVVRGKELAKMSKEQLTIFRRRNIGFVFQNYNLVPILNVYENIVLPVELDGDTVDKRFMDEVVKMLGLEDKLQNMPNNLSGGQQQRVAIARALINKPDVLLLDEPLGALDLKLRREMQLELKRIQRESGITFIFVTHDQEEALTMSDRVAVMSAGHILQLGTPEDIYNEPQSAFVADFIGDSDIMAGTMVRDRLVRFLGCDFACVDTGFGENAEVDVVLRPEDVKLKPIDDPAQNVPQGVVESLLFKGVHYEMKVRVGDNVLLVHSTHARPVGTQVKLTVAPEDIQVMRKSDYSPDILKRHAARA